MVPRVLRLLQVTFQALGCHLPSSGERGKLGLGTELLASALIR